MRCLNVLPLLFSAFACASGLIATQISVLGVLSNTTPGQHNLGAGAGIFFCAIGMLFSSMSLFRLGRRFCIRELACFTTIGGYLAAGLLWLLHGYLPIWMLSYLTAVIYASIYVIINYCLSVSVYRFDEHIERGNVAKKMALPFFAAQAIMPFASGRLFDDFGIGAMALLVAFSYSIPVAFILLANRSLGERHVKASPLGAMIQGIPGIVLFIAAISTFALNWYFSSVLTILSDQNIPMAMIGGVISALNVAGIIGAGWVASSKMTIRQQVNLLFLAALICCPAIVFIHSLLDPGASPSAIGLLIFAGLLTGITGALISALKFTFFDKNTYIGYHRLFSMLSIGSTLAGSLMGSLAVQKMGWSASLLTCVAICALATIKPFYLLISHANKGFA